MIHTHEVYTIIDQRDGEQNEFQSEDELLDFLRECAQQEPVVFRTRIDSVKEKATVDFYELPSWWRPMTEDEIEARDERILKGVDTININDGFGDNR